MSPPALGSCVWTCRTRARRVDLEFHLTATSLRMFNVYGPGQSLENLVLVLLLRDHCL